MQIFSMIGENLDHGQLKLGSIIVFRPGPEVSSALNFGSNVAGGLTNPITISSTVRIRIVSGRYRGER